MMILNPHPVTWGQIDTSHQFGREESPLQQRVQKELTG